MFYDPSLSGSGQLSCASCHSPANAYAPTNDVAVQFGGRDLTKPGLRAAPSMTYIGSTPIFTIGPGSNIADDDGPPQARVRVPATGVKVASIAKADAAAAKAAHESVPGSSLDWAGGGHCRLLVANRSPSKRLANASASSDLEKQNTTKSLCLRRARTPRFPEPQGRRG
jgi:Di-haem cytochrome c peroxidase